MMSVALLKGLGFILVLLIAAIAASPKHQAPSRRLYIVWLVFDGLVHLCVEGSFLYMALAGTLATSDSLMGEIWREYALADARWGRWDDTIVSMECLTVGVTTPLALALAWGVAHGRPWRHIVQVVLATCELYGGWMTFGPEWLVGSPNLVSASADPVRFWVHLVFFNGLWVVIPLWMLWQTAAFLSTQAANKKSD